MDIGAFAGNWTQLMKRSGLFPNAEYLMFEANIAQEGALAAIGEPYVLTVLGDVDGKEVLYHRSLGDDWQTHSGNSVYLENTATFRNNFDSEMRRMRTVDAVMEGWRANGTTCNDMASAAPAPWDLIKLDVQGSEIDILQGAVDTIRNDRPVLITELSLVPYNAGAPTFFDVHIYMESIDYVLADIVEVHYAFFNSKGCCSEITPMDTFVQSDLLQIDVLWVPREKASYSFSETPAPSRKWNCVKR